MARLTVVTLGVADVAASSAFYEQLGFIRKMRATGDEVAFLDTGASALALYRRDKLAAEAGVAVASAQPGFRGVTLAWNCGSAAEVDAAIAQALAAGATPIKPASATHYGGYAGYVGDPDGHVWEIVTAPGLAVRDDGRLDLPA